MLLFSGETHLPWPSWPSRENDPRWIFHACCLLGSDIVFTHLLALQNEYIYIYIYIYIYKSNNTIIITMMIIITMIIIIVILVIIILIIIKIIIRSATLATN